MCVLQKYINKIQKKYWKIVPYDYRPGQLWYRLKCRLWHRYNVVYVKTLPSTWVDRDHLLLHAAFQILVDFIEREDPVNTINIWYSDEWYPSREAEWMELYGLYSWWIYEYPNPQHDKTLEKYHAIPSKEDDDNFFHSIYQNKQDEELAEQIFKQYMPESEAFDAKVDENLAKLISLRGHLWT